MRNLVSVVIAVLFLSSCAPISQDIRSIQPSDIWQEGTDKIKTIVVPVQSTNVSFEFDELTRHIEKINDELGMYLIENSVMFEYSVVGFVPIDECGLDEFIRTMLVTAPVPAVVKHSIVRYSVVFSPLSQSYPSLWEEFKKAHDDDRMEYEEFEVLLDEVVSGAVLKYREEFDFAPDDYVLRVRLQTLVSDDVIVTTVVFSGDGKKVKTSSLSLLVILLTVMESMQEK